MNFFRLIEEYGSAAAALDALPQRARAAGIEGYAPCPLPEARREYDRAQAVGAQMICCGAADYPTALYDLPAPPPILWARGARALLHRPALGIVGARNASSLGRRMARDLSRDLGAQGYVIVSGLARGTDAAAHRAALDTGTIAVLGGGVDAIYPRENTDIYNDIAERGVLLSEQPMGVRPIARHFPPRNRIIAALSQALIVIEAAAKSGSLISARDALDLGHDVMAVPGHPLDPRAFGGNALIRDGALLVRHAGDVIEALPPNGAEPPMPAPPAPTQAHQSPAASDISTQIMSLIGPAPVAFDTLLHDLHIAQSDLITTLNELALEGRLTRCPGNFWMACP